MFGCGLPVCAARYKCIDELVKENLTGLLFDSPQQLSLQLVQLFQGFPGQQSQMLRNMQHQVQQNIERWPVTWSRIMHIF